MSLIIIDSTTGKITVMPNTHDKDNLQHDNIECALNRYAKDSRTPRDGFEWMEFDGPLTLNLL